jgi:hypothetical protein
MKAKMNTLKTVELINIDGTTAMIEVESDGLRQLQNLVGGDIEGVRLKSGKYLMFASGGKFKNQAINQSATDIAHKSGAIMSDDYIAGVAVITD